MTAPIRELHAALYTIMTSDVDLMDMVKGVHDRIPKDSQFPYASFGPSTYIPLDASCIVAGEYTIQIDVWSRAVGSGECYDICDKIKRLIHYAKPDLPISALAVMRVTSLRQFNDPDGLTEHGVITVEAIIEER